MPTQGGYPDRRVLVGSPIDWKPLSLAFYPSRDLCLGKKPGVVGPKSEAEIEPFEMKRRGLQS